MKDEGLLFCKILNIIQYSEKFREAFPSILIANVGDSVYQFIHLRVVT
jgi:hypothetical protein